MKRVFLLTALSLCLLPAIYAQDTTTIINIIKPGPFERFRFGVRGGMGYLLASSKKAEDNMISMGFTPDQTKSYYRNERSGYVLNADLAYLVTPKYGLGIKYKFFSTSASTEGFVSPGDGTLFYGTFSEQIYVNFAGVAIIYQNISGGQKFRINTVYSFGLATYRNEAEYVSNFLLLNGKSFAGDIGIEAEYRIAPFVSVTADVSAFYSSIGKMKISDGTSSSTVDLEKENRENLTRLDLSLGIIFYLWKK